MRNRLMWQDVVLVHRALRKGEYRCEQEIFEREAELLNDRLAPTHSVSATRVDKSLETVAQKLGYHVITQQDVDFAHQMATQEIVARKLSGYDDATWFKLREDRKRTYRRAADSLITQWPEFAKLFEVKS